jgi:hypothetical protein
MLVQALYGKLKQHSEELFSKLCLDEKTKNYFEQKLKNLQDTFDPESETDAQSFLDKELFNVLDEVVREQAIALDDVNQFKTEVQKCLLEQASLRALVAAYTTCLNKINNGLLAMDTCNNAEMKETARERLHRINLVLEEVFNSAIVFIGLGTISVLSIAACRWLYKGGLRKILLLPAYSAI